MKKGPKFKLKHNIKLSISLPEENYTQLCYLCELADLPKSNVVAMAILHFYKGCTGAEK